jgi:hypothetical protein
MKRFSTWTVLLALLGLFAPGQAFGSITAVGGPVLGDCWSQPWDESNVGDFNAIAVQLISGGPFDSDTGALAIVNGTWQALLGSSSSFAGFASSSVTTDDLTYSVCFASPPGTTLPVDYAYEVFAADGSQVDQGELVWDGRAWSQPDETPEWVFNLTEAQAEALDPPFTPSVVTPIPEPASMVVWSLVGIGAVGLAVLRRVGRGGSR